LSLFTAVSHQFEEIFFNVLKDEVGLIDDSDDLFEFDDVLMIHFSKGFDF
jgi:hypothetical protein